MTVTLHLGDCLEILPTLEAGSVDAVITDPPYGIGYASSRTMRMNGEPRVNDASFGADVFDPRWVALAVPTLCNDGALYAFTRWDVAQSWKQEIESCGLKVHQRIVWDKRHWGMGDLRYYGSQTEDILFASKGAHVLAWEKREGNLWSIWKGYVWSDAGGCQHPTQKPERLISEMITRSCPPGGTVLDPFMGSGTTGVACVQAGRNFIGIEIDPTYYAIAEKRIAEAQLQPALDMGATG